MKDCCFFISICLETRQTEGFSSITSPPVLSQHPPCMSLTCMFMDNKNQTEEKSTKIKQKKPNSRKKESIIQQNKNISEPMMIKESPSEINARKTRAKGL